MQNATPRNTRFVKPRLFSHAPAHRAAERTLYYPAKEAETIAWRYSEVGPESTGQLLSVRPIGTVRSPHTQAAATPVQPVFAEGVVGRAEILPECAGGLADLEGFSHIWLLYWFHEAGPAGMSVKPYLQDVEHGVFATRAPTRPNPIGLSLVRLVRREGTVLHLEDVDLLDGTPLLDVKPYVPRFDHRDGARTGWMESVDEETAQRRGRRQSYTD